MSYRKRHINKFQKVKTFTIALACILTCISVYVSAQISLETTPLNFNSNKNDIKINNHSIILENKINYQGEVYLKVYMGAVPNSDKLIAKSELFALSSASEIYQLQSIFDSNSFRIEKGTKNICIQILQANNDLHLGMKRVNVFQQSNTSASLKNKDKLFSIDGNLRYQLEYGAIQDENSSFVNSFNADISTTAFGVPFDFTTFQTSFKDQFSAFNPSNLILSFDKNLWEQKLIKRIEPALRKELESKVGKLGEIKALEAKMNYLTKLTEGESFMADLTEFSSLDSLLKLEGIQEIDALESKIDEYSSKLDNVNSSITKVDSLTSKDSLLTFSKELQEKVERLEYYQSLKEKSKAFQKILLLKDSCEVKISRYQEKFEKVKEIQNEVLKNPTSINALLEKNNIETDLDYVLNYVSEFKVGLNNPRYSSLAFRRTINNGMSVGLDFGKSTINSFGGKLQNLPKYIIDTAAQSDVWAYGFKYNIEFSEHLQSEAFISTVSNYNYQNLDKTKSLIGYNLIYSPAKNSELKLESIWSTNEFDLIDESEESTSFFIGAVRNAAMKLHWKSATKSNALRWNSSVEYFGPDFYDIENYFDYNNFVNSNLNVNTKISRSLTGSFFVASKFNNLWERNNIFDNSQSTGLSMFFSKKKWPFIQYSSNVFWNNGPENNLFSSVQNLLVSSNAKVLKNDLGASINLNYVNNQTNIDTIFSNIFSSLVALDYSLTEKSSISLTYDFSKFSGDFGSELAHNLIVRYPYSSDHWGIDLGAKFISLNKDNQFGFLVVGFLNVHKKISINLEADSHRQVQFFNESLNNNHRIFRPFYRFTLNYKL